MRDFINAILAFIGASSLTDLEFGTLGDISPDFSKATYSAVLAVLDGREVVSTTRDRLAHYFQAAGTDIGDQPSAGKSKIFLGAGLCS